MEVSPTVSVMLEAAKVAAKPSGYASSQVVELKSQKEPKPDASPTEVSFLRVEAEPQELEMRIPNAQARVAQEVAIAMRIVLAEVFYEYVGTGNAG